MGFRYIGAKTGIIEGVLAKVKQIVPSGSHVADLMCGTGAVSAALRREGYRVTANDVMTYSYHHARVALLFTSPPMFEGTRNFIVRFCPRNSDQLFPPSNYQRILQALNNVQPEKGYFWKEFSVDGSPKNCEKPRNYFSPENAGKIDGVRSWVRRLHESHQIDDLEHSLLIHDLIMAANDCANIAGTYGHYMSKFAGRMKTRVELKPTPLLLIDDRGSHNVLQGFAERIAGQIRSDLCYIDPPYMKRQYAANYHILETLAREDEPEAIGVSGLRPWRDQYSNFCTKTRIRDSFREIFLNMDCPHFLVSYSEDGLLSRGDLEGLLSDFGEVQTTTFNHKRFKSHDIDRDPCLTEYLFHLRVKCPSWAQPSL
jgi:adenine-specific DNA-methyltransferase